MRKIFLIFVSISILTLCISITSSARLPTVGGDSDTWGTVLNEFLNVSINGSGELRNDIVSTNQIIDGTITDADISDTMNLTLGEKITFAFGEMIDNLVDGFIKINGNLRVEGTGNFSGTIYINNVTNMTPPTCSGTDKLTFANNQFSCSSDQSGGGESLWTNVSGTATYDGNVNITGNLTLGGEVTGQSTSRVRVTGGTQTINNNEWAIVQYNTEDYDNLGEYDNVTNYKFTATNAGYYLVIARIVFDNVAWDAGERAILRIYKNGAVNLTLGRGLADAAVTNFMEVKGSDIIYLDANDYIDIRLIHNQGTNIDLTSDHMDNHLAIQRLHSPITIGGTNYWNLSGNNLFPESLSYNVGIGTTSPNSILDIGGLLTERTPSVMHTGNKLKVAAGGTQGVGNGASLQLGSYGTRAGVIIQSYQTTAGSEDVDLIINLNRDGQTAAPEVLRIKGSSGNVGIGTSSPGLKLDVNGSIRQSGLVFYSAGTNDGKWMLFDNGAFTTEYIMRDEPVTGGTRQDFFIYNYGTGHLGLMPAGNVGIGKSDPAVKLHVLDTQSGGNAVTTLVNLDTSAANRILNMVLGTVNTGSGNSYIVFLDNAGNTQTGSIVGNTGNDVQYLTTSDIRTKQNIQNLTNVLPNLMKINPVTYESKNSTTGKRTTGFSAQEIYNTFGNEVAVYDNETDLYSIDYGKLTPILTKAIQEQQLIIQQQNNTINQLKAQLQELCLKDKTYSWCK